MAGEVATLARAFLQFVHAFGVTDSGTRLFRFPCSWLVARGRPCDDAGSMLIDDDDDGCKSPSAKSLAFPAIVMLDLWDALKGRLNAVSYGTSFSMPAPGSDRAAGRVSNSRREGG